MEELHRVGKIPEQFRVVEVHRLFHGHTVVCRLPLFDPKRRENAGTSFDDIDRQGAVMVERILMNEQRWSSVVSRSAWGSSGQRRRWQRGQ